MKFPRLSLPASARSLVFRAYLRYLASSSKPIVIGPFRSELGFECLYWLPLLNWALKRYGIGPERCIALSRGGMGKLYPAAEAVDLYSMRTVDQVRLENQVDYEQRKMLKQTSVTEWDRQIAHEAAVRVGKSPARRIYDRYGFTRQDFGRGYHLLHPSWMYWLFDGVWQDDVTLKFVAKHCDFAPLPIPDLPTGFELPKKFVAVRFYERHTFPLHPEVVNLAREMVQGLAAQFPVVLLNQQTCFDDHADLPIIGPNSFALPQMDPAENLLLQAAVLARCQAFVGTYGGVAQWALRYRKPSLSFYTQFTGTLSAHRNLSHLLAAQSGVPFEVADLRAVRLWKAALAPVVAPSEPEPVAA